jgi:hypothetical protein
MICSQAEGMLRQDHPGYPDACFLKTRLRGYISDWKERLMRNLLSLVVLATIAISTAASAQTTFGVRAAEGYILLFKDGASSGPVNTRLEFTGSTRLNSRLVLSFAVGAAIPNDAFRPAPRACVALVIKLTYAASFALGPGYQYNVSYGDKQDSHFTGFGFGPSYRIGRVTLGFTTGPGWTSRVNVWSWLFQPSVGVNF